MKKRIFHKKNYNNPYFKSDNNFYFRILATAISLLIFFFAFSVPLFFFRAKTFEISEIRITSDNEADKYIINDLIDEQISAKRFLFFYQKNIFLFSVKQAKKNIQNLLAVENLNIKKKYFTTLEIIITTKQGEVLLASGNKFYLLDRNGLIVRELTDGRSRMVIDDGTQIVRSPLSNYSGIIIMDSEENMLNVGDKAVPSDKLAYMLELDKQIREKTLLVIENYRLSGANNNEFILTEKGAYEIRLRQGDPKSQVEILNLVLNQEIKNQPVLEYIDLRYGESVYWK